MQVHSLRLEVVTGGRRQPGPRRPHRACTYRAQCPMPHQGCSSWFQPSTLRIQRSAFFTSGCCRPEDQKVVCGVHAKPGSCENCEAAAAGRHWRRPSAVHIGRWLAWGLPGGHLRRTRGMTPTHDCSTDHQAGLEWPVAARRRTRSGARERRHRHGQHGGRQPERQPGGAAAPACSCECAPRERHPTPHLGVAQLADSALLGAP